MLPPDLYQTFLNRGWQNDWNTHAPAEGSLLEMVIVEPRPGQPNLEPVLKNFSCLVPYAALTVVHSPENAGDVSRILGDSPGNVRSVCLPGLSGATLGTYNQLLMSDAFWGTVLKGERILIFQTDTGLRRNGILSYWHCDYVGAPWTKDWAECGLVGNGGLSMRSRKAMQDVCGSPFSGPEDVYFARELRKAGRYAVATPGQASGFSVEAVFHPNPVGFHKAYDYLPRNMFATLVNPSGLDPASGRKNRPQDAWLEAPSGRVVPAIDRDRLTQWASLGVGTRHWAADGVLPGKCKESNLKLRVVTEGSNTPRDYPVRNLGGGCCVVGP